VGIAVSDDETKIAILDPAAERQVQIRATDGTLLAAFGRHGEGAGTLSLAAHVTWGPSETLWVTDTLRHCISVYDVHGEYLGYVGGFGRYPGQFSYPVACAFLEPGKLVVVERGGGRCQILEVTLAESHSDSTLSSVKPVHRSALVVST
jgi:hypothetical protein